MTFRSNQVDKEIRSLNYVDREGEFKESAEIESYRKKTSKELKSTQPFNSFIDKLKRNFALKYNLNLRRIDVDVIDYNNFTYLLDVRDIQLEKYENRDIKMKTEKMITSFQEKYRYKNLTISKEAPNYRQIQELLSSMKIAYNSVQKSLNLDEYLKAGLKSEESDKAFKQLRPNCPFELSELLSNRVDKVTFAKHCSNNLFIDKFKEKD